MRSTRRSPRPRLAWAGDEQRLAAALLRILNIFRITGLTQVFGIYQTVDPGHRGQEVRTAAGFAVQG
jgi:hypothetical protein